MGLGYDAHRFAGGRDLVLGGVSVPFDKGLAGHSDADVIAHAIIDALLGAAVLGDIGTLFPDTETAFAGAVSVELLAQVVGRVREAGWRVGNVDVVVVLEEPRLGPYREAMRERLATALGVETGVVSIKATTSEGMGFEGRREGISATAICLLEADS